MEKIPITNTGKSKVEEELKILKTMERPRIINDIAEANSRRPLRKMQSIMQQKKSRLIMKQGLWN